MQPIFESQDASLLQPDVAPSLVAQKIAIAQGDRWLLYTRLRDLQIPCWCLKDGSLWAEVEQCSTVILIHSVMRELFAPRQELVDWLNRCWQMN